MKLRVFGGWQPKINKLKKADWGIILPSATIIISLYVSLSNSHISKGIIGSSSTVHDIANNPIYLPYKIISFLGQHLPSGSILHNQLATALLGLAAVYCVYYLLSMRLSRWLAIVFSTLFGLLPWMSLASGYGSTEILMFWPVFITYYLDKLVLRPGNDNIELPILVLLIGLGLYIPGVNVLMLALGILYFRPIKSFVQSFSLKPMLLSLGVFVASLSAAVYSYLKNNNLDFLGLSSHSLNFGNLVGRTIKQLETLFWNNSNDLFLSIGKLPLLNVSMLALIAVGGYSLYNHQRKNFNALLIVIFAVSIVGAIINIPYFSTILLPLMIYIAATGLKFSVDEWFGVFPINPFAKYIAVTMVVSFLAINIWFDIQYTHYAWPNYPPVVQSMIK